MYIAKSFTPFILQEQELPALATGKMPNTEMYQRFFSQIRKMNVAFKVCLSEKQESFYSNRIGFSLATSVLKHKKRAMSNLSLTNFILPSSEFMLNAFRLY